MRLGSFTKKSYDLALERELRLGGAICTVCGLATERGAILSQWRVNIV